MINSQISHNSTSECFARTFLGKHAEAYCQYLADRQYAEVTVRYYLTSIEHYCRWESENKRRLNQIDEASVLEFLNAHLPVCQCPKPAHRQRRNLRAALGHLLIVLRLRKAIAPPLVYHTPVDCELISYEDYMKQVRGLAQKTRSTALRIIKRLLDIRFGNGPVDVALIDPEHVRRFYAQQSELYSKPANTGPMISALRGYFRYRSTLGDDMQGLIGAIPYPANWQLSCLPKALSEDEMAKLVGSLGQPGRSMRRNDAIVRCAFDLGLRSAEVAKLCLDDINWHSGTITLRGTKGQRVDVLPLPISTGDALAAYLQYERPVTTSRAVFIRLIAPRDQPVGADLVRKTIRQAYARAGLPYTRSHLLRHTMANRLLDSGASLKEVADVLRHRSLNTAMIYAKLDSRKLVEVAAPWPGSLS